MSLISEALKKAQAQREEQSATGPVDPVAAGVSANSNLPPPIPVARTSPVSSAAASAAPSASLASPASAPDDPRSLARSKAGKPPQWGIVVGVVAVVAIIFGGGAALIVWGVLGLTHNEDTALVAASNSERAAPYTESVPTASAESAAGGVSAVPESSISRADPVASPSVEPVATPSIAPSEGSPASLPSATRVDAVNFPPPPRDAPAVVTIANEIGEPVIPAVATPVASSPIEKVVAPDPEITAFVSSLEIRGVMRGGQRILIFDPTVQRSRAYAPNEILSETWELLVVSISPQRVEFVDERGATYFKRF